MCILIMSNATQESTPGYNCRLTISFNYDRNGRKVAYYYSRSLTGGSLMGRKIRMPVGDAVLFVAQGQADEV